MNPVIDSLVSQSLGPQSTVVEQAVEMLVRRRAELQNRPPDEPELLGLVGIILELSARGISGR